MDKKVIRTLLEDTAQDEEDILANTDDAEHEYDKLEKLYDYLEDKYTLVDNPNNPGMDTQFETFGADLEFIKSQDPKNVFTAVTDDEGHVIFVPGVSFVNRLYYVVTKEQWKEETEIYI